jgi:homoserine dehydrogenase
MAAPVESVDVPVALLGYGMVGSAVARLLSEGGDDIERATRHRLRVVRALVRDPGKTRAVSTPPGLMTDDSRPSATIHPSSWWRR